MSLVRCCLSKSDAPKHLLLDDKALVRFEYLNQGGANVIFKILPWSGAGRLFLFADRKGGRTFALHHQDVTHQVLRVDKGVDKTLQGDEVVSGFHNHLRPLFVPGSISIIALDVTGLPMVRSITLPGLDLTKHLMEHQAVMLEHGVLSDLMSKCDSILPTKKSEASTHRWGILLPDMSPVVGSSVTIEVKPKWLAQSPNAPPDAIRCRTCAMQVARPKDASNYICPLRLSEGSNEMMYPWIFDRVAEQLAEHSSMSTGQAPRIAAGIVAYLTRGDGKALLEHLKFLQTQLDHHGVCLRDAIHSRSLFDHNLRLAMTLRDCSLYITARYDGPDVKVDSKLGDLDFKSADKMDDWASKEEALLREAAYTRPVDGDWGCLVSGL